MSPSPPQQVGVFESDALFWMGDLNYRIDLSDSDVRTILASKHWTNRLETLYKYDQLRTAISNRRAFEPFSEFPITHVPTYRFSSGVLTDEMGYDTKRRPAWCDRILYLDSPAAAVHQYWYNGYPNITFSDHRPVAAAFHVDVDLFDRKEQERASRRLHRQVHVLDVLDEVHDRATVAIDGGAIDLGTFGYGQTVRRELTIKNVGKIPCTFRFVPAIPEKPILRSWLHLSLSAGLLLPGEAVDIALTATINDEAAAELNRDRRRVEQTLILHVLMGKDHFVTVSGDYQPTCFANSLSRLTRLPGSIRELKSDKELLPEESAANAPREIVRLVNWLMSHEALTPDIFFGPSDSALVDTIRNCLDTSTPFPFDSASTPTTASNDTQHPSPDHLPAAFASALLQLLASLTEPVVPYALYTRCTQMMSRDEAFGLLEELPPHAVNVWVSVTAFLHFISQSHEEGKGGGEQAKALEEVQDKPPGEVKVKDTAGPVSREAVVERLATLFFPVLMPDDASAPAAASPVGRCRFLRFFID